MMAALFAGCAARGSAPQGAGPADEPAAREAGTTEASGGEPVALENTDWKLTLLGGEPVGPGAGGKELQITLVSVEKVVQGFAGCNRIAGGYQLAGTNLSFPALIMTKMGCMDHMDQERAFAKALNETASWKIAGGRLELLDARGNVVAQFEPRPAD
jgi:putative lipoprotein